MRQLPGMDSFDLNYDDWVEHWQHVMDTNLMSAVHISYWAVRHMKESGGGKIINVASRAAFRGETEYLAYAASKAALVNFTRSRARTTAKQSILAYAVAPGFIEAGLGMEEIHKRRSQIETEIPSGRIGTPGDVAGVVLFLASEYANYLSGSTIDMNGSSYFHRIGHSLCGHLVADAPAPPRDFPFIVFLITFLWFHVSPSPCCFNFRHRLLSV
jgi:3-oxoacyl-[acyl-carrier protein] reductase